MTGDRDVSALPASLIKQPIACQSPGCSRNATKANGYVWCYWCDPSVPEAEKAAARQLGGRRGQMTASEAAKLFEGLDLANAESRAGFRLRLMEQLMAGKLTSSRYRDLLAGLEAQSKDQAKGQAPPAAPLVVEVQRFTTLNGPESTP
jgi:hypothetical protein